MKPVTGKVSVTASANDSLSTVVSYKSKKNMKCYRMPSEEERLSWQKMKCQVGKKSFYSDIL
jgi:hypothetical protein